MSHAFSPSERRRPIHIAAFLALSVGLPACSLFGDHLNLSVTRYTGPPITHTEVRGLWSALIDADEVTLLSDPDAPSDRSFSSIHLVFENHEQDLPTLKDVWMGPTGEGVGTAIRTATVEIQSWDLAGEISGTVWTTRRFGSVTADTFWMDLSQTAVTDE
jgi:hypothetical protein